MSLALPPRIRYTALSRNLCILGSDGVDLLSEELNAFFDTLVNVVHQYGGDIYKFAGDAIMCLWTRNIGKGDGNSRSVHDMLTAAIQCGFELVGIEHYLVKVAQAACATDSDMDISKLTLPDSLGLHCAVGIGPLEMAAIGSPPEFICNGASFAQVERSLSASVRGELAISSEAWDALLQSGAKESSMDWKRVDVADGVKRLELKPKAKRQSPKSSPTGAGLLFTQTWSGGDTEEKKIEAEDALFEGAASRNAAFRSLSPEFWSVLLQFEPPIILKKEQDEGAVQPAPISRRKADSPSRAHPHEYMVTPQIRSVTILFVSIAPTNSASLLDLHPVLSEMQKSMHKHNAFLRQFLVDDKGIVLIAALGVPKYSHPDDVDRAIATGLEFSNTLAKFGARYSIGVSSGLSFCGCVGNNLRQEYAIIGSTVNLAAKIMAKKHNQNGIHVDEATRERTDPSRFSFTEKGSIVVKGFDEPVTIYEPKKVMLRSWSALRTNIQKHKPAISSATPSRRLPFMKCVKFLDESVAEAGAGDNKTVLVRAARHLGRTQFVKDAVKGSELNGFKVFKCAATSRTAPLSAAVGPLRFLCDLEATQDADAAMDRLESLLEQLPKEDAIGAQVKDTLLRLLLKQTSEGRPKLKRTPSLNSAVDVSLRIKASIESKAATMDSAQVLAKLVRVSLEGSQGRFKNNVALVVMEELQLCDDASRRLLQDIVREAYCVQLLFVFTSTDDAPPSAGGMGFSFDHEVDLHPLTLVDTRHILEADQGARVEDDTVALVQTSAGGAPYWIVELGRLTKRAGKGTIQAEDALKKCVLERFDELNDLQQEVLQQCAVMAFVDENTCSLSLAVKLASEPEVALQIMQTDLLHSEKMSSFLRGARSKNSGTASPTRASAEETFRFNHTFTIDAIYQSIPRKERLLMHEKVATAIILESLTGYEIEMKHELETIAKHFELGLCHDQFNRYLALAISETMASGSAEDIEALVRPFLERFEQRFEHHHDQTEAYAVLRSALELGHEKMHVKQTHTFQSLERLSSIRSIANEKHLIEVTENELLVINKLIEDVVTAQETARATTNELMIPSPPTAVPAAIHHFDLDLHLDAREATQGKMKVEQPSATKKADMKTKTAIKCCTVM